MKAKILALSFVCFIYCSSVFAQDSYSIKGSVIDTASKSKLANSVISVLNSKDSTLAKFTRAKTDGTFAVNGLAGGKFILLLTYPGYADYVEHFELAPAAMLRDFGQIRLTTKARLLAEVIISGRAAISFKGDTTIFSADKFKVEANAKVEDLLKQFPGIEVDKDGKITAQGQTVTKMLVDGEEFFGDDPTLVTKNLRADMVANVELFDKKSDQATFTGVDDGQRTKTMNVVLKEDKKNGYFGKTDIGGATASLYQGQAMVNYFKAKQKVAAYGTLGNTGKTGLSLTDNLKYSASNLVTSVDVGGGGVGISISGGGGDEIEGFDGTYRGVGIPVSRTGGAHFDTKWNKDKASLNTNYKLGSMDVEGSQNTLSQQLAVGDVQNRDVTDNVRNSVFQQKLDAAYVMQYNPNTSLKISADGTLKNNETKNDFLTENTRGDYSLQNRSIRNKSTKGEGQVFNASALFSKRLKKAGRTMTLGINQAYTVNNATSFETTATDSYDAAGAVLQSTNADQYKTSDTKSSVLSVNATYTEPLSKTFTLSLAYGLALRNDTKTLNAYDKSAGGQYDILDTEFSNDYDLEQMTNGGTATLNYNKNKTVLSFTNRISAVGYNMTDLYADKVYERDYLSWSPSANYTYRFSQQKVLTASYSGSTLQPSLTQIQPIKANDDPLRITIGNADLKQSFRQGMNFRYSSSNALTSQNFSVNGGYSMTTNPIAQNMVYDTYGKSISQAVNMTDKTPINYNVSTSFGKLLQKSQLRVSFSLNASTNTGYSFINSDYSTNKSFNYGGGLTLSKSKLQKYNFYLYVSPTINSSTQSLRPANDIKNRLTVRTNGQFGLFLPGKVEIRGNASYTYTEKVATLFANKAQPQPIVLNSTISKKFLQAQNLMLSFSANDLLKQNVGFSQFGTTQTTTTVIPRYYMMSLTWDFTKMGGVSKPATQAPVRP